ncbi:MAG TPA: FHA domain-containing protein [Syntrophothermus lipocalidus]|nr:FHA domain-containing protein [Syntrophothermus lipocalidus]
MENLGKKISPALFALIIICFLMPFVSISCSGQEIVTLSGVNMVFGKMVQLPTGETESVGPFPMVIVVFVLALVGVGVGFWKNRLSNVAAFAVGLVGPITMCLFKSSFDEEAVSQGLTTQWGAGYYLTLLLFLAGAGLNLYLMVRNRGALPAPGLARSGPRFCIQCGARNEGGNAFCTQCGARLEPGGYGGSARTSAPFSSPANVAGEAYGPGEDEVTTVLDDSGDTRLLEQVEEGEPFPVLRIKRAEEEEIIPINKPEFYIGRNREAVDYCEADNPSIGRVHAKIIRQDGAYYIVDLESKNGTYLNGERLSSNVPYPLSFKDKIRLANIEYTFDQP